MKRQRNNARVRRVGGKERDGPMAGEAGGSEDLLGCVNGGLAKIARRHARRRRRAVTCGGTVVVNDGVEGHVTCDRGERDEVVGDERTKLGAVAVVGTCE